MKIQIAELKHLDEIIKINKFVDYWNPDDFLKESIEKERIYVAPNIKNSSKPNRVS